MKRRRTGEPGDRARLLPWTALAVAVVVAVAWLSAPAMPRYDERMVAARTAMNEGRFADARDAYRFALAVDGRDRDARSGIALADRLHRLAAGQPGDLRFWRERTAAATADPYLALYGAELALQRGEREAALARFSAALAAEPALVYARRRLASLAAGSR